MAFIFTYKMNLFRICNIRYYVFNWYVEKSSSVDIIKVGVFCPLHVFMLFLLEAR